MNQTQSIVVYRNPIEATFWESGMAFPLMAALFVFFVIFLSLSMLFARKMQRSNHPNIFLAVFSVIAAGCSIAMFNTLMI